MDSDVRFSLVTNTLDSVLPIMGMPRAVSQWLQSFDLAAELVDPFNPTGFGKKPAGKSGGAAHTVSSDREILENIASRITPSGMLMFNDNPLLLFREKKLKVGDTLTITFEGTDYVVVITEIERTSFKIRLNREEITRPIKPGKTP